MTRERLTLCMLLCAIFGIRAIHPDQPIVENYVGRQIPTAMVARNLERGSGFLSPQLDTGPFPNLFLVEPPIYAQLVGAVRPLIGFDLEATGRLVSAAATAFGAWGLFGLVRRREGSTVAFLALASFGIFPVMVRYGRAFQPDALMVGCVLAGLRGWDEFESTSDRPWAAFGGFVLATGLALKITVAWALIPFILIVKRWPLAWRLGASAAMLVPAFSWYFYAWGDLARSGMGSLASSDNATVWLRSVSPRAWLHLSTYDNLARGLALRSFTPVGFVLACWGLIGAGKLDPLWKGWAIGCGLAILGLATKWHHGYYWMVVAPLAAVGVGRGLVRLGGQGGCGRSASIILASFFLTLCLYQSASTWRTPAEWCGIVEAGREVASMVPDSTECFLVAPEALIYYADRRGFRLEYEPDSIRRAVGEWGKTLDGDCQAFDLVGFYAGEVRNMAHVQSLSLYDRVSHVADVGLPDSGPGRRAFREAIRKSPRYRILVDRPDLLIAE